MSPCSFFILNLYKYIYKDVRPYVYLVIFSNVVSLTCINRLRVQLSCCRVSSSPLLLVNELALGFLSRQHVFPLLSVFSLALLAPVCPVWKCEMWDAAASAMQLSRGKWTRPVILSAARAKEISSFSLFQQCFVFLVTVCFPLSLLSSSSPHHPTPCMPLNLWQSPETDETKLGGGHGVCFVKAIPQTGHFFLSDVMVRIIPYSLSHLLGGLTYNPETTLAVIRDRMSAFLLMIVGPLIDRQIR